LTLARFEGYLATVIVTCPHGAECPGCPLLALPYEEQLIAKRERVKTAMGRFVELARTEILGVVPADPIVGYRSRAKLVVAGPLIGLYVRGTHRVVDIPECRVLDPELSRAAEGLRRHMPAGVTLRAVDLRRATHGVLATLVVPDRTDEGRVREAAEAIAKAVPEITGIAASFRDERSHQVLGRAPTPLMGIQREKVHALGAGGPFHFVAAGSFTQAHTGQQRRLLEGIIAAIETELGASGQPTVLDLYSGVGALALSLAARGARVVAVESYEPAAALAQEAARAQDLDVRVEAADAADAVRSELLDGHQPDVVIVNPPRRGLSPAVREAIPRLRPRLVVYVSCEPLTLARDLADFARRGYTARTLTPFDMMPLTKEVEGLALLVRSEPPLPEVVYEDERLIAVLKSPHEPTTPQGEHVDSLLSRVRRLEGAEEAVPVHRLDIGTSGVCLMARKPAHVSVLSKALAQGQKEYVALCKGVVRDKGSIRRPLVEQGRPHEARTRYARREIVGGHSRVTVRPDEGRKHQIRRHLASLGHPVVGDDRYGDPRTNEYFLMRHFLDRPFLHCARIELELDGRKLELHADLAPDLDSVLESLAATEGEEAPL
jgi:23S rRNA (uracil1939-C5)-methyltransferase